MQPTRKKRKHVKRQTRKQNKMGSLKKGHLTKFGYRVKNNLRVRRRALSEAVKRYGGLSVFRKLNAVYVLHKNKNPTKSKVFKRDRNWIKRTYMKNE